MNRIDKKFKQLATLKTKAFIAFITAGYPDLKTTKELILELAASGVDIIELGVPFSDPIADGPVIQEASFQALKKNVQLNDILSLVKDVRKHTEVPLCLMTYYNPIFNLGDEAFLKKAQDSGVDGVIIPDLPPEEGKDFIKLAKKYGVANILFIAPTTSKERMKAICSKTQGFIYYVSLTGVTGERVKLPLDLVKNLKFVTSLTKKPVCVGFGISNASQVKMLNKVASGVIVGSAIVKKIKENIAKPGLVKKVGIFVKALKKG